MENIVEPNDSFDFKKLSLAHPTGIQGGAYFTKIEYNNKPLYIQTNKSYTKQGFVKTGKKYYCDLMFDKNSESLINWFENLEDTCKKLIYEKKETWFQNTLEENDIETAFNSLMRIYKSGKYYLVRTNIKNNLSGVPAIKIYDEFENPLAMTDITNETNIITILEIQGIKFTTRNFQIEIELKQVMVLNNEPVFDNCLIKTNKKPVDENINLESINSLNTTNNNLDDNLGNVQDISLDTSSNSVSLLESIDDFLKNEAEKKKEKEQDSISLDIEMEDLNEEIEENNDELKEFDVDLKTDNLETIQLKKPNQVYFELYKEAKNKAKQAKKTAILAYLEAKNIKKTYLIENIDDSDSEFEAEIDEVSESELEGL